MSKPLLKKKNKPTSTPAKKLLATKAKRESVAVPAAAKSKPLVRQPYVPVKPKSGPKPDVPKGFKWKGEKDPRNKGHLLVAPADMPASFPKPHILCVPDTYFRVDKTTNDVKCLVSILPHGVHVAWWECGVCINHVTRCICRNGYLHNRGIEWLYIKGRMDVDKLPMANEPRIDSTGIEVRSRAIHWYKGRETAAYVPKSSPQKPAQPRQAPQPVPQAARPSKPLQKTRKPLKKAGPSVDVSNVDLAKVNQDAASMEAKVVKDFEDMLSKPKKTLKKRK